MSTSTQPTKKPDQQEIEHLIKKARTITDFKKAPEIARQAQYDNEVLVTLVDRARDINGLHWRDFTLRQQRCLQRHLIQILSGIYLECGSSRFYNSLCRVPFVEEREMRSLWKKRREIEIKMIKAQDIRLLPFLFRRFRSRLSGIRILR